MPDIHNTRLFCTICGYEYTPPEAESVRLFADFPLPAGLVGLPPGWWERFDSNLALFMCLAWEDVQSRWLRLLPWTLAYIQHWWQMEKLRRQKDARRRLRQAARQAVVMVFITKARHHAKPRLTRRQVYNRAA